jgi:hypothetical protein
MYGQNMVPSVRKEARKKSPVSANGSASHAAKAMVKAGKII